MIGIAEQGKKHIPGVEIVDDKVIIKIGHEIEHPMIEAHYIISIDILEMTKAGWMRVEEVILNPEDAPEIMLLKSDLKPGVYSVQARCNLHGTFENQFII